MQQKKEIKLTDHINCFKDQEIDLRNYEVSFRRWIISQLDGGHMSFTEIRNKFNLPRKGYYDIIKRWQVKYSDKLHLFLSHMSSQERVTRPEKNLQVIDINILVSL